MRQGEETGENGSERWSKGAANDLTKCGKNGGKEERKTRILVTFGHGWKLCF